MDGASGSTNRSPVLCQTIHSSKQRTTPPTEASHADFMMNHTEFMMYHTEFMMYHTRFTRSCNRSETLSIVYYRFYYSRLVRMFHNLPVRKRTSQRNKRLGLYLHANQHIHVEIYAKGLTTASRAAMLNNKSFDEIVKFCFTTGISFRKCKINIVT